MPFLDRPDGVQIHWEERGEGPLVVFLPHWYAYPAVYESLLDELARDLRVVTYDPRGCGESTRQGPFEVDLDVEDLEALVDELGGGAVAAGMGDGRDRAVRLARTRPDLVHAVVSCGTTIAFGSGEGPGDSTTVFDAALALGEVHPRAAVRGMLELTNPGLIKEQLSARIDATLAYAAPEAFTQRGRAYSRWANPELPAALGNRLWIAAWTSDWSPGGATSARKALPDANVRPVEEGPISRPDLTAEVIREAVRASR